MKTTIPMAQVFYAPGTRLRHVLKVAADLPLAIFKTPTFGLDNSIEYAKSEVQPDTQPDDINGYRRDPNNGWRFLPVWPKCVERYHSIVQQPNGCIQITMACNHPEAATYGQPVDCGTCEGCPLRATIKVLRTKQRPAVRDFQQPTIMEDGTLIYPKTGWEPPVCPDGYNRKVDNLWAFEPMWQPCVHRAFDNNVRPCGCVSINALCRSPESGFENQRVAFVQCKECPVRKEPVVHQIQ